MLPYLSEIPLAEDQIISGPELEKLLENTSHFESPHVLGLVKPRSLADLEKILRWARECNISLYTFSRGLNWGLGSRLPVSDHCLLVELSAMNNILEINTRFHYAIVEPGVTQGQLAEAIEKQGLPLMLNVTGSHPNASVTGNIMERGSGFLAHRIQDLRGMEVMLADGSVVRSGFWNLEPSGRELQHFPYGIGPDWRGLFSQSDFLWH